jgi:hypothetical protein
MRRMVRAQMAKKCVRFCHHAPHVDQPQIDLVDQRRGLEGVAGSFVRHITLRHPMRFLVDQGREPVHCLPFPRLNLLGLAKSVWLTLSGYMLPHSSAKTLDTDEPLRSLRSGAPGSGMFAATVRGRRTGAHRAPLQLTRCQLHENFLATMTVFAHRSHIA